MRVNGLIDPFLERRRGHDDLEGRAGRILALHGAGVERMARMLGQLAPALRLDAAGELVGIEGGTADHGQHVAVARIERDDRAGFVAERRLGRLLQVEVDAQHQRVAGDRLFLVEHAQLAAERVDLDLLAAVHAAQVRLPRLLEPRLADHVAGAVAAVAVELAPASTSPT